MEAHYAMKSNACKWQIESVEDDVVTLERFHWFKNDTKTFEKDEWNMMMLSGEVWKVN